MTLKKENYTERLIDSKISKYLTIFGAICIEGPKWCGKTWTSLNHVKSVSYLSDRSIRDLAKVSAKYIFLEDRPQLIDEWQLVPSIWDAVRHECDTNSLKGKFILTGSTTLIKEDEEEVNHSGTGRIHLMRMYPMSLYESGDSSGEVGILDLVNDTVKVGHVKRVELNTLAALVVRGGWPENRNMAEDSIDIIPKSYLDSVVKKDINERKDTKRDSRKMMMLIRSLARNESSVVSISTILNDILEYANEKELIESRITLQDYLKVLDDLFLTSNQEAFNVNYRSSSRIGKSPKRHFVDPSLACAALDLSVDKLMHDLNTFGFMFESLVVRDLKIYMDYLDGNVLYFRDNNSGDEVDAILEFRDGSYGAVEIKLTDRGIEQAKKSLLRFYESVKVKPKFMCIIMGYYEAIVKDEDTGIYILPITSLKP